MPVVEFSSKFLKHGLVVPEGRRRIEYCDRDHPGLYLEVRVARTGAATWYFRQRVARGRLLHTKLGRFHEISHELARDRARQVKARFCNEFGTHRHLLIPTLRDFYQDSLLPYLRAHKRSWRVDESIMRFRVLPRFGDERLYSIRPLDVQRFHLELLEAGLAHQTCDHHLSVLRQALKLAVAWELLESNPASDVKPFRIDSRRNISLDGGQLRRLVQTLRSDRNRTACSLLMFLLFTGARLNEAVSADWQEIDLENRVWRIPARISKSRQWQVTPLNSAAMDILRQLPRREGIPWLFESSKTGARLEKVHRVWYRIRDAAGMPLLRIHDLRHVFANALAETGRTVHEIQRLLHHAQPSTTQRYVHLLTKDLLEASEAAALRIQRVDPAAQAL